MTQEITLRSQQVESLLARFKEDDLAARDELLQATCGRFNHMARAMKRDFPKVGRWEQTEDIVQQFAQPAWPFSFRQLYRRRSVVPGEDRDMDLIA